MMMPKEQNGLAKAADALFASRGLRRTQPEKEAQPNNGLAAAMDTLIARQRPSATGAGHDRAGQTPAQSGLSAAMAKVIKELPRAY